jgi:hypothetical protein
MMAQNHYMSANEATGGSLWMMGQPTHDENVPIRNNGSMALG